MDNKKKKKTVKFCKNPKYKSINTTTSELSNKKLDHKATIFVQQESVDVKPFILNFD